VAEVDAARALPDLWALSFRLPSREDTVRCFDAITRLAESVPVYELVRPLRFDALAATIDRLTAYD
jgi:hypothetical protein